MKIYCAFCTEPIENEPYYHDLVAAWDHRQDYVEVYEYVCERCHRSTYVDTQHVPEPYPSRQVVYDQGGLGSSAACAIALALRETSRQPIPFVYYEEREIS